MYIAHVSRPKDDSRRWTAINLVIRATGDTQSPMLKGRNNQFLKILLTSVGFEPRTTDLPGEHSTTVLAPFQLD